MITSRFIIAGRAKEPLGGPDFHEISAKAGAHFIQRYDEFAAGMELGANGLDAIAVSNV
jgi:hypothetical protein